MINSNICNIDDILQCKLNLALSAKCQAYLIPDIHSPLYDPELRVMVVKDAELMQKIWPYVKAVLQLAYKTCKRLEVKEWYGVPANENKISDTYVCFKIAYNRALQPRAVACYEGRLVGRRGTGLGREKAVRGEEYRAEGLEAVSNIVRHDIKNAEQGYWAEISDDVEDLYISNGAPVIPNNKVASILQVSENEIIKSGDGLHYERIIRMEDKSFKAKKIMWGSVEALKLDNHFKNENI